METQHQPDQDPTLSREPDRRNFFKMIMAAAPGVGLACAIPSMANASERKGHWVCRVEEFPVAPNTSLYIWVDCANTEMFVVADVPGLPLGDCSDPDERGCEWAEEFAKWERSEDSFRIAYSPRLPKTGRQEIDRFKSILLYQQKFA